MKIIVTGGAGFIGSALIRYLITHTDHTVINVDKLTYAGNLASLASIAQNERYHFEQEDICNAAKMDYLFSFYQPDAVMHLAAESHVDRSIQGPAAFIHTNIIGTYTLLEATRHYWQSLPENKQKSFRFHHISTDEVYGDLHDSNAFFTETTPYAPSSPYSASKASSDHLVRAWHRTYNLPVLITNCSNNYGPYQFPEKLIPVVIAKALTGQTIPVYGQGLQIRDWLYVDDHVRALYAVLYRGQIGETYNIGGHNEKTNIDVVLTICALLDELMPHASIQYANLIQHVTDRPGHDQRYAIDASKMKATLNWQPQETFETGLRKTVMWYLQHQSWSQTVLNMQPQALSIPC